MVAIFNGLGGAASAFVASSEFLSSPNSPFIIVCLSVFIGSLTFTGSFVAFGKLQGFISGRAVTFKGQQAINAVIALLSVSLILAPGLFFDSSMYSGYLNAFFVIVILALILGVGLTILDFVGPVVGVVTGTRGTITIESGADINTIGSANQVLFKNASNDATTSPNLTFNGTNLVCAGTVTANSDERLKENVETIPDALDKVKQLRGVEFDHKNTGDHCLGVIAQEVEKIVPDVVYEDALGVKSVAYMNMVALLIEAVKDQQKQIDELKSLLNN